MRLLLVRHWGDGLERGGEDTGLCGHAAERARPRAGPRPWPAGCAVSGRSGSTPARLRRARETAAIVGAELALEPETVEALREISFGEWEGCSWEEIQRRWPREFAWCEGDRLNRAPPGGESYGQLMERALPAVEAIRRAPGGTAVARLPQRGDTRRALRAGGHEHRRGLPAAAHKEQFRERARGPQREKGGLNTWQSIFSSPGRGLRAGQGHHGGLAGPAAEGAGAEGGRAEAGPIHKRGPGHHEPLSARGGVRHGGRGGDGPRPGALRALHRRGPQPLFQPHHRARLLERAEQGAAGGSISAARCRSSPTSRTRSRNSSTAWAPRRARTW